MLSVFSCPSRYTQGKDATQQLGQEMVSLGLGGPALIMAGRTAIKLLAETWRKTFSAANIDFEVHAFGGECSLAEIERIKHSARKAKASTIISTGGGKALDAGRAAAADLALPIVNCPTIASSDAPCSALSVIYSDEGVFEQYRIYPKNPDLVLILEYVPEILERAGMKPDSLLSEIRSLGFEIFLITPDSGELEFFSKETASRKGLRAELLCERKGSVVP